MVPVGKIGGANHEQFDGKFVLITDAEIKKVAVYGINKEFILEGKIHS